MLTKLFSDRDTLFHGLLCIAVVGSLLIFSWGIWAVPTLSFNEARRMIVVQEMLAHHNWLIPTLNNQTYIAKPPLFYWLALFFCLAFQSTAEWVMRLPSVLGALGITWFLFARVKKYFGRWPALFSAFMLVTSYYFSQFARSAEIEMVLTAFTAGSVLLYFDFLKAGGSKKYLYLSYASLGLACLAKGPVVLIFFIPPILLFGLFQKDTAALKGLISFPGWLIFILIALPWYVTIWRQLASGAWGNVVHADIAQKIWGAKSDPVYAYILLMLGAFAPWTLLFFYKTRSRIRFLFTAHDHQYFSLAFGVPLVILSCFSQKNGKYALPLFPHVAVFLGVWLSVFVSERGERRGNPFSVKFALGMAVLVFIHAAYFSIIETRILKYRYEALAPMVEKLRQYPGTMPVYSFARIPYRLICYYNHPIPLVSEKEVDRMISQGDTFLIIAEGRHWKPINDRKFRKVLQYAPYLKRDRKVGIFLWQGDGMKEDAFTHENL